MLKLSVLVVLVAVWGYLSGTLAVAAATAAAAVGRGASAESPLSSSGYTYSPYTLGKLDHYLKKPQQVNGVGDVLVGGRLTTRQVAGVAESGFQSYVSVTNFATDDTVFNNVTGDFPSSSNEQAIFEAYGLSYTVIPVTYSAADAKAFSAIITAAPKPVYVHCYVSYSSFLF
jgi:protein tyrosine phosphatase (PTP) superfamily phosphohydrolase (DUF442 family)